LANEWVGGHVEIDNFYRIILKPWNPARRQLHVMNPIEGGIRKKYGSTRSLSLRRMSLVTHPNLGLAMVGGTSKGRVSLHRVSDHHRLAQNSRVEDIRFRSYYPWNFFHIKDLHAN
jgi:hypothetical protein